MIPTLSKALLFIFVATVMGSCIHSDRVNKVPSSVIKDLPEYLSSAGSCDSLILLLSAIVKPGALYNLKKGNDVMAVAKFVGFEKVFIDYRTQDKYFPDACMKGMTVEVWADLFVPKEYKKEFLQLAEKKYKAGLRVSFLVSCHDGIAGEFKNGKFRRL